MYLHKIQAIMHAIMHLQVHVRMHMTIHYTTTGILQSPHSYKAVSQFFCKAKKLSGLPKKCLFHCH